MDVFVIRTRLQALIVKKIIENYNPSRKFVSVFSYQKRKDEDSQAVYEIYEEIKHKATFSIDVLGVKGVVNNFLKFFFVNLLAFLSRGKVHLAGIDNYPLALSVRLFPFVRVNTFDDGSANFLNFSKYYSSEPLEGNGLKRKVARWLFPQGCAKWMRDHSDKHYTIFPSMSNIVDSRRLSCLDWDWDDLLDSRDFEKLPVAPKVVVLGTPHQDHSNTSHTKSKATKLLDYADLYIMHPRELQWVENIKMVRLHSPAEAVLIYLSKKEPIVIYHFNSTTAYALGGFGDISFVNMIEV